MSWKPKFVLLVRAVCILVPEWSVQWYDALQLNLTLTKLSVQLEQLPVYCFLTLSCVSAWLLRSPQYSLASSFQVVLGLSNATGLLHIGIYVFLESRLVTLNIWSPEPSGCVIQRFALHFMQLRQETKDFWTPIVGGFVRLWTWVFFFPGVDCIARWALCQAVLTMFLFAV